MKIILQNNCKFLNKFDVKIKPLQNKGFECVEQNIVTRLEKLSQKIWQFYILGLLYLYKSKVLERLRLVGEIKHTQGI